MNINKNIISHHHGFEKSKSRRHEISKSRDLGFANGSGRRLFVVIPVQINIIFLHNKASG